MSMPRTFCLIVKDVADPNLIVYQFSSPVQSHAPREPDKIAWQAFACRSFDSLLQQLCCVGCVRVKDISAHLRFCGSGNHVLVDANGDGTANIKITLAGLTNANKLSAGDFIFV